MARAWLLLAPARRDLLDRPDHRRLPRRGRATLDRRAGRPLPRRSELWLWRRFEGLLRLEHGAFVVLVGAGLARLHAIGLTPWQVVAEGPPWLRVKILVVLCVMVPLEAYDIHLSHVRLPRLLTRLESCSDDLGLALAPVLSENRIALKARYRNGRTAKRAAGPSLQRAESRHGSDDLASRSWRCWTVG